MTLSVRFTNTSSDWRDHKRVKIVTQYKINGEWVDAADDNTPVRLSALQSTNPGFYLHAEKRYIVSEDSGA